MGNMTMVLNNLMATAEAKVVAVSSASASMDDMNMRTETPSEFWRSGSNAPRHSWFYAYHNTLVEMQADAVGLIGHNLSAGDQYRIYLGDSANPLTEEDGYIELPPTATAASSNTSAGYADIDNAESSSPGTFAMRTLGDSGVGGWSIRVSFGTPSPDPPSTGADRQAFWVYVKGETLGRTYVECSLYEAGVLVSNLGSRPVTSSTGQWLCFPWDASLLVASDGSDVECLLSFGQATTVGNLHAQIWSLFWACDTNATDAARDSGWITYDPDITNTLTFSPIETRLRNAIFYRESTAVSTYRVYVYLRVIGCPMDFTYGVGQRTLPAADGYCQVGTLVIGESWMPTHNIGYSKLVGAIDISSRMRSYGGQLFGARRPTRRVIAMRLNSLTPAEAHLLFDWLIWRGGVLKPILISLLPDDATQKKHTTILAVLRNPENWVTIQPNEGFENSLDMEWEEVL